MMDCESRVQNDVQSNDTKEDVDTSKSSSDDLYSYMKRGEFTSEIFKIEVKNLPKHIGYDASLFFLISLYSNLNDFFFIFSEIFRISNIKFAERIGFNANHFLFILSFFPLK